MTLLSDLTAIISQQQALAAQVTRDFQAAADAAANTLNYYFLPQYPPDVEANIQNNYTPPNWLPFPNLLDLAKQTPPARPEFLVPEEIVTNPLELLDTLPELELEDLFKYSSPSSLTLDVPRAPTIQTNFLFPAAPNLTQIDIPPLIDVNIPTPPGKPDIPPFLAVQPKLEKAPPNLGQLFAQGVEDASTLINGLASSRTQEVIGTYYPKVAEQTTLVDEYLCGFVQGDLKAIPASTWDLIFARTQARNDAQATRINELLSNEVRRAGLPYMDGDVRVSYFNAQSEAIRANYDANIAITEQEANREFQQMQFVLQMLHDIRKSCSQLWINIFESVVLGQVRTSIEYATAIVNAHAEEYNQLVRKFEAEVRLYVAEAQVWEIRAKYAFIEIELYRQLLEAAKLESEVNTQLLRQTEQRIAIDERFLRKYALEIEAINTRINAEELKIRIYEAQVRAFQVQISAKGTEIELYKAQISGDQAKISAQLSKLEAYNSQLNTIRAYIEAQASLNTNKQQYNRILTDTRDSDIRMILANFEQDRATASNKVEVFRAQIGQVQLQLQQALDTYRTATEADINNAKIALQNNELRTQQQQINMSILNEQRRNLGNVQLGTANLGADVAGAINAGINQFINVGSQEITNV